MKRRIEFILYVIALFAGLIGAALTLKRGEYVDVEAYYAVYLPGSPLPDGVSCQEYTDYMGYYHTSDYRYCRAPEGGGLCKSAHVWSQDGAIRWFYLSACDALPLAYLIGEYGWPDRIRRYKVAYYLYWSVERPRGTSVNRIYAIMRRWALNPMASVSYISWSE